MTPFTALAYLQSIGWHCVASTFPDSDTRQDTPIFRVYNAVDQERAYGTTEALAWDAAVEYARYRGLLPDTLT